MMVESTDELWTRQNRHDGDRVALFRAVAGAIDATRVLYPGSWVDVAASFVWPEVVYVDTDRRAARFFADAEGVGRIVAANDPPTPEPSIEFIGTDFTTPIPLPAEHVDLLISLYAGFVSEHCTHHLRVGGTLLVNSSHGDAAMASIDPRYRLCSVVAKRRSGYVVTDGDLATFLVPKKPVEVTRELLHATGRGVAYTRSPAAYLFERVA
jgi:hypothetical protein